jgi:hypothetical protein
MIANRKYVNFSLFYSRERWDILVNNALRPFLRQHNIENKYAVFLSTDQGDHVKVFFDLDSIHPDTYTAVDIFFKNFFREYPSKNVPEALGSVLFANFPNNSIHYNTVKFNDREGKFHYHHTVSQTILGHLDKYQFTEQLQYYLVLLFAGMTLRVFYELELNMNSVLESIQKKNNVYILQVQHKKEIVERNYMTQKLFVKKKMQSLVVEGYGKEQHQEYYNSLHALLSSEENVMPDRILPLLNAIFLQLGVSPTQQVLYTYFITESLQDLVNNEVSCEL